MSLQKPHLYVRFKKASILLARPADTNTPQAGNAYNSRETIKPTKHVHLINRQKRLNHSRCRLGCGLGWAKQGYIRWGPDPRANVQF